jgi:twitching motility protein PilT
MQTFDQSLLYLYQQGKISMDEALKAATHPHDFKLLVAAEGQRSTSVEQIYSADASEDAPPPSREEEEEEAAAAGNFRPPATT